ncbi:hypothetical protein G7054_g412 [Neopestalotiopsis clavispora]|nr:hypothetical protein G7054_g412 [Neopestalotiopsis clavispora]
MSDKNDPKVVGKWGRLFQLRNVPVHATLLPNGRVIHWGRRKNPKEDPRKDPDGVPNPFNNMDEHETRSFLWTPPADGAQPDDSSEDKQGEAIKVENQPTYINPETKKKENVNLFCSGHSLMPDGNLLVTGGHLQDGWGTPNANIFNWKDSTWVSQPAMLHGRWYPSVLSLPDGRMLSMSGSYEDTGRVFNSVPQLFSGASTSSAPSSSTAAFWTEAKDSLLLPRSSIALASAPGAPGEKNFVKPLFPRLHVDPSDGRIFMTGPEPDALYFQIKKSGDAQDDDFKDDNGVVGSWELLGNTARPGGFRDYASSIMYAPGKIMYMGGGVFNGVAGTTTDFIDLTAKPTKWEEPQNPLKMKNARRHFNGTILPDGTVLLTGGTSGFGFNNLDKKVVVKTAELMDPEAPKREWKEMAAEVNSRCYHSIALLLPDGRVLSAGGGEWADPTCKADECHADGQLFEPPYLHRDGSRLSIATKASDIKILYDKPFSIDVGRGDTIEKVNLVKLGSVTHCCNFNQHFVPLAMTKRQEGTKVFLQGPKDPNFAPPGHYMLFVLNKDRKPSMGSIVQIAPLPSKNTPPVIKTVNGVSQIVRQAQKQPTLLEHDDIIKRAKQEQDIPQVKVGITPLCPYGLGPCWGGAHNGLQAVSDIDVVRPVPHNDDCLAYVYLKPDTLPDLDVWREEFQKVANHNYKIRGVDMTLSGVVAKGKSGADELVLSAKGNRPEITLKPFKKASQLRWNLQENAPKPITDEEAGMYKKLVGAWVDRPAGVDTEIKGTLQKQSNGKFTLDVRTFKTLGH